MREAPGILDALVNEVNELVNGGRIGSEGIRPKGVEFTEEILEEIKKNDFLRNRYKVLVHCKEK